MELQVSSDTLQQTKRCPFKFACLRYDSYPLCNVSQPIEGNGLFVGNKDANKGCSYKISYGFTSQICVCPTRIKLFAEYNR